jgi:mxaL protein
VKSLLNFQSLKLLLLRVWQDGTLFFVLALIALLPIWFEPQMPLDSVVQDTLFVIDISESMNVRDVDFPKPQSDRLTLAKLAVRDGMAALPCGSRVAIGLFAGDEVVILFEPLEICRHFPAIEQVVTKLDSKMRWIGDSWVVRALVSAIKEAEKRKLNLVMVTDADEMPHHSAPRIADLIDYQNKVKGVLWGVGGEAPQPVPRLDGNNQIIGYWTPEEAVIEGNHPNLLAYVKSLAPGDKAPTGTLDEVGEHLSAYNKVFMQTIAQTLAMEFIKISHPNDAVQTLENASYQKQAIAQRDARWIFGLLALVLTLFGWFWALIRVVR